jgi:hypothetical protein
MGNTSTEFRTFGHFRLRVRTWRKAAKDISAREEGYHPDMVDTFIKFTHALNFHLESPTARQVRDMTSAICAILMANPIREEDLDAGSVSEWHKIFHSGSGELISLCPSHHYLKSWPPPASPPNFPHSPHRLKRRPRYDRRSCIRHVCSPARCIPPPSPGLSYLHP